MDSLSIGAAVAIYVRSPSFTSRSWHTFVRCACFVILPAIIVWIARGQGRSGQLFSTIGYTAVAIGFSGLLGLALMKKRMPIHALLEQPVLQWFGKYSYGLYLYHMLVLGCFSVWRPAHTFPDGTVADPAHFDPLGGSLFIDAPLRTLLVLSVTALVAWLSFQFLEQPFLRLKDRFAPASNASSTLTSPRTEHARVVRLQPRM
jgi:peptidoglycan/LPS O-acetylase OafA/YrhL